MQLVEFAVLASADTGDALTNVKEVLRAASGGEDVVRTIIERVPYISPSR